MTELLEYELGTTKDITNVPESEPSSTITNDELPIHADSVPSALRQVIAIVLPEPSAVTPAESLVYVSSKALS